MTNTIIPPKKGTRKKSGFYHAVNEIIPHKPSCAELLGVTVEQVEQWMETGNDLAEKYIRLWDKKHINFPGWEGFSFSRGVLIYKNKLRWTPELLHQEHKRNQFLYSSRFSVIDTTTEFRKLRVPK